MLNRSSLHQWILSRKCAHDDIKIWLVQIDSWMQKFGPNHHLITFLISANFRFEWWSIIPLTASSSLLFLPLSVLFPFIGICNHCDHQSNRICPNLSCLLLPFVPFLLPVRFNLIHSHLHLTSKGLRCWFPPCIIGLTRVFTRLICTLSFPFSLPLRPPFPECVQREERERQIKLAMGKTVIGSPTPTWLSYRTLGGGSIFRLSLPEATIQISPLAPSACHLQPSTYHVKSSINGDWEGWRHPFMHPSLPLSSSWWILSSRKQLNGRPPS